MIRGHSILALLAAVVVAAPANAQGFAFTGSTAARRSVDAQERTSGSNASLRGVAPPAWNQQDPADPLYRQAREHMNASRFREAADLFARIIREFPRSTYAPDAYYYQAFSLYRLGGDTNLTNALRLLEQQTQRHASAATHQDAEALLVRINGELARSGNSIAAVNVVQAASAASAQRCSGAEDDVRTSALNALLHMDSEMALPIVKQVLANKDACNAPLRRRAMFIVSQMNNSSEKEDILLDIARTDTDLEVRKNAVFWLSQVNTERAVNAIEQVLNSSADYETRKQSIFALSQNNSPKAAQILRSWAERNDGPVNLRADAIFWLGQRAGTENGEYLRSLYPKLRERELKDRVLFSVSQRSGSDNGRWLTGIALDQNESIELRKKALFWAGQAQGVSTADLVALWNRANDHELKKHLVFVYSQRREREIVDKMIDIAKTEQDRELRKQAIFWLGQMKDPRVAQALLEIIGADGR